MKTCPRCNQILETDKFMSAWGETRVCRKCLNLQAQLRKSREQSAELAAEEAYLLPKIAHPTYAEELAIQIVKHNAGLGDSTYALRITSATQTYHRLIKTLKSWKHKTPHNETEKLLNT